MYRVRVPRNERVVVRSLLFNEGRNRIGPSSHDPSFSVVVPTHERPAALGRCLHAIASMRYPRDRYEVIVDDDGGRTPLDPLVDRLRPRLNVRLVRQERAGPAAARNRGGRLARGERLAFTDDDCEPEADWLASFEEAFDRDPSAVLGGRTVNAVDGNLYSTASELLIDYLHKAFDDRSDRSPIFPSNNLALSARLFAEAGGFDTGFRRAGGEDRELVDRLARRRVPFRYVPSAVFRHAHDLDLPGFLRQHTRYGMGAHRFRILRTRATGTAVPLEPLRFYRNLVSYPFRRGATRPGLLAGLLVLSQVANAAGFAVEWVRTKVAPC